MSEHSPLPWTIDKSHPGHLGIWASGERAPYHREVAVLPQRSNHPQTPHETTDANVEFIVRAVNTHDELLAALKAFLRAPSLGSSGPGSVTIEVQSFNLKAAEAAIRKAEGGAE